MRVRLAVVLAAVGGVMSTSVAAAEDWCGPHDRKCVRMSVPLDHSGQVPGTLSLRIERARQHGHLRPPLIVLAGGPGESSTSLPQQDFEQLLGPQDFSVIEPERSPLLKDRDLEKEREVVVVDVRGTGWSSPLRCPSLQRQNGLAPASAAAACARSLGPRRAFYTAADAADDVEAVRRRLGVPSIAIYGVSYGARVALTYARRYPARVERLVLQSVSGPDGIDPLRRSTMRVAGDVLERFCAKRCRGFTRNARADLSTLMARLEQAPISGYVTAPNGERRPASIDSGGLLGLIASNTFAASEALRDLVPAAVRAALDGDPAQLLRVHAATRTVQDLPPVRELSGGARAAVLCEDSVLPWTDDTPLAGRRAAATALVSSLPPSVFAPFGARTALASEVLALCERWPLGPRRVQAPPPALPDVPALIFAGTLDAQTPVADARAVAALLPRARLMVVRGAGHEIDVVQEECLARAFRRFLVDEEPGVCPPVPRERFGPFGPSSPGFPYPRTLRNLTPADGAGRPGRTLAAVLETIHDSAESFGLAAGARLLTRDTGPGPTAAGALRGGSYVFASRSRPERWSIRLKRASVVPGVRVSGSMTYSTLETETETETGSSSTVLGPWGTLDVSGPAAARGKLRLRREGSIRLRAGVKLPWIVLTGRLGGRKLRAGLYGRRPAGSRSATASSGRAR